MSRVLVVDDDRGVCRFVESTLRDNGHEVEVAESGAQAIARASDSGYDVVFCDLCLNDVSGLDVLRAYKSSSPETAVVVMTSSGPINGAVEVIQMGARDSLRKPFLAENLLASLRKAETGVPHSGTGASGRMSAADPVDTCGILGNSRVMRESMDLIAKVADTESTVLITGETGTGKELFGRAIHQLSRRRDKLFCAVNSAAFPEALLESELFGHRRGAFTGASSNKKGLIEHTHRGTLFLDEVAEMPLSMQAKLLRFLQTGEIRPVGGETTRYVDVRLITATNKDLEAQVSAGSFREDLFYRLAVIPVHVPPLRDRADDIPMLVSSFLERFSARVGKSLESVDPAAMDLLASYSWPGNVRQLENSIERAVALCRGNRIGVEDLPTRLRENNLVRAGETIQSLQVVERAHILNTLDKVGWNRKQAAELLQISTTTLWRRLKEFGVEFGPAHRPLPPAMGSRS